MLQSHTHTTNHSSRIPSQKAKATVGLLQFVAGTHTPQEPLPTNFITKGQGHCVAVFCSMLKCNAVTHVQYKPPLTNPNALQHSATHCNTLQHTATHCNTLQHKHTHHGPPLTNFNTLQHTATHCNNPRTTPHEPLTNPIRNG